MSMTQHLGSFFLRDTANNAFHETPMSKAPTLHSKTCKGCGIKYETRRKDSEFHSGKCANAYNASRRPRVARKLLKTCGRKHAPAGYRGHGPINGV